MAKEEKIVSIKREIPTTGYAYFVLSHNFVFPFNNCSDDDEFIKTLSELSTSPKQVNLNILDDMLFDPFQLNEFDTDVHLFYINPDLQYFNMRNYNDKLRKCNYYSRLIQ